MNFPIYRVDAYIHPRGIAARRTEVADLAEAHHLAEQEIRAEMAQVNILMITAAETKLLTTYFPASPPSLHTRPSKD